MDLVQRLRTEKDWTEGKLAAVQVELRSMQQQRTAAHQDVEQLRKQVRLAGAWDVFWGGSLPGLLLPPPPLHPGNTHTHTYIYISPPAGPP